MVNNTHDSEAPFNMAVATLMRLDAILQQIRFLDYRFPIDSAEKQKSYLGLVKQFYINSVPLLKDSEVKLFQGVLSLNIDTKEKISNGNQKTVVAFDHNLDIKLNKILIKLQLLLRKYFMPKGRDLSKAVAHIN